MNSYCCEKCGKKFDTNGNYRRHLKRKNPCGVNINQCKFCSKIFSYPNNARRHEKICKLKLEYNNTNNLNDRNKLHSSCNNGNNNVNGNITKIKKQINVNIVPFGEEKYSKIPKAKLTEILKAGFQCVPKIVEYLHCNDDLPQNHNICKKNLRDNKLVTFDGKKWIAVPMDDTLEDLYNKNADFLVGKFQKLKKNLSDIAVDRFNNYMEKYDSAQCLHDVREPLILLLYNNRDIIMNSHKK